MHFCTEWKWKSLLLIAINSEVYLTRNGAWFMFSDEQAKAISASLRQISCAALTTACRPLPHSLIKNNKKDKNDKK